MSAWLVVNIGCIECGVSSDLVGVYTSKPVAEKIAASLRETHNWRQGGQNHFEVWPMPEAMDVTADEYSTPVRER